MARRDDYRWKNWAVDRPLVYGDSESYFSSPGRTVRSDDAPTAAVRPRWEDFRPPLRRTLQRVLDFIVANAEDGQIEYARIDAGVSMSTKELSKALFFLERMDLIRGNGGTYGPVTNAEPTQPSSRVDD